MLKIDSLAMESRHRLFVYGSLKRGFSNAHFLTNQQFLSTASTPPEYRMFDYGGFPAAIPVPRHGYSIQGELWEIDESCLQQLDWLEDVEQGLYVRASTQLLTPKEVVEPVIMYHYIKDVIGLREVFGRWITEWDIQPPCLPYRCPPGERNACCRAV